MHIIAPVSNLVVRILGELLVVILIDQRLIQVGEEH
jgi:hypothetical protein